MPLIRVSCSIQSFFISASTAFLQEDRKERKGSIIQTFSKESEVSNEISCKREKSGAIILLYSFPFEAVSAKDEKQLKIHSIDI